MTPEETERLREERGALSAAYKRLLAEISSILFRHDPIGINFDDNTDEYDPEAGTILPRLRPDTSIEQLTTIVHEEFVRWFDREIAGPKDKYSAMAEDIQSAYLQWVGPR